MKTEIFNTVVCVIVALYVIIRLYVLVKHNRFSGSRKAKPKMTSQELPMPDDSSFAGDIPGNIGEHSTTTFENLERDVNSKTSDSDIPDTDFRRLFLVKRANVTRKQSYMSQDTYEQISRYLRVITPDLTVPAYVDNVLRNHIEQYREQINELYMNSSKKPI